MKKENRIPLDVFTTAVESVTAMFNVHPLKIRFDEFMRDFLEVRFGKNWKTQYDVKMEMARKPLPGLAFETQLSTNDFKAYPTVVTYKSEVIVIPPCSRKKKKLEAKRRTTLDALTHYATERETLSERDANQPYQTHYPKSVRERLDLVIELLNKHQTKLQNKLNNE